MVQLAVSTLVGVLVARHLGPTDFGHYSIALATVALILPLTQASAPLTLERLATDDTKHEEALSIGFAHGVFGALAGTVAVMAVAVWMLLSGAEGAVPLLGILGTAALARPFFIGENYFFARQRAWTVAGVRVSAAIAASLAKLICIWAGASVVYIALSTSLEVVLGAAGIVGLMRRYRLSVRPVAWRAALADGSRLWPMVISGMSVAAFMRIDQLMVGALASGREAGDYAVAVRISELAYILPLSAAVPLTAEIMRSLRAGPTVFAERVRGATFVMAYGALALSVPIALAAPEVVSRVFGDEYFAASSVVRIHAASNVFVATGTILGSWAIALGLERLTLVRSVLGLVTNVVLNLLLIPRYGGEGAAWATLVAYFVSAVLGNFVHPAGRQIVALQARALATPRASTRLLIRQIRRSPSA